MNEPDRYCRTCGETWPFDTMCACDRKRYDDAKAQEINNHPEPGGHHAYVGNPPTCACGLVYGSDPIRFHDGIMVRRHRRYPGDTVTFTDTSHEDVSATAT